MPHIQLTRRRSDRARLYWQYFSYLRRNPTDPPNSNNNGYQFWLAKLNAFNGDFVKAEMVNAFLVHALAHHETSRGPWSALQPMLTVLAMFQECGPPKAFRVGTRSFPG